MRRELVGLLLGAVVATGGCEDFRDGPSGAAADAAGVDDAGVGLDAAAAREAGAGLIDDQECPAWTGNDNLAGPCGTRRVAVVRTNLGEARAVGVARHAGGTIALAFGHDVSADEGKLAIARFSGLAGGAAVDMVDVPSGPFERPAVRLALAPSDAGFVLVHQALPDGELRLRAFHPSGAIADAEVVLTGLGSPESVAVVERAPDDFIIGFSDSGLKRVATRERVPGGQLGPVLAMAADLVWNGPPDVGALALARLGTGAVMGVTHIADDVAFSQPRAYSYSGAAWTSPRTLDNSRRSGFAGMGVSFATWQDRRAAAYYARSAQASTAELRLATWDDSGLPIGIELVDPNVDITGGAARERVRVAYGPGGFVHVLMVVAQGTGTAQLVYLRQTQRQGRVVWLRDIVDADIGGQAGARTEIALAVDSGGRPHIAYFDDARHAVYYASRFDLP